ncbi:MAG: hypothetical protein M1521_04795, partial [Thermotogae bacterium]|nr:hypothetical protein [Thermotogota bacterium]
MKYTEFTLKVECLFTVVGIAFNAFLSKNSPTSISGEMNCSLICVRIESDRIIRQHVLPSCL